MGIQKCSMKVYYGKWARTKSCEIPATKQDNKGVWWCGTHHPDAVKAREQRREQRYKEEMDRMNRRNESRREDQHKIVCYGDLVWELRHLVLLIEPFLEGGGTIPGLATLNGAKEILEYAETGVLTKN